MIRLSILLHRWLGLTAGLLALIWFASGLVVHWYAYPEPTREELLPSLRPAAEQATEQAGPLVGPLAAADAAGGAVRSVRFQHLVGQPVYQVHHADRAPTLIDGRTGEPITLAAADAGAIAAWWLDDGSRARSIERLTEPTTLYKGYPTQPLPAYRVRMDDAAQTDVYIAESTGEVANRARAPERVSRYLGGVPHYLDVGPFATFPLSYVITLQALCGFVLLMSIAGVVYGVWRWLTDRRAAARARAQGRDAARPITMKRLHLWLGLGLSAFVVLWAASGIVMVYPGSTADLSVPRLLEMEEGTLVGEPELRRRVAAESGEPLLGYELLPLGDRVAYRVLRTSGEEELRDARTGARLSPIPEPLARAIAAERLGADAPIAAATLLTEHDSYYYENHGRHRPLPAYRVDFADAAGTALYIEREGGRIISRLSDELRFRRWAGTALHSFDFPFILRHFRVWEIGVAVLTFAGVILSVTGLWLGVRFLRRKALRRVPA